MRFEHTTTNRSDQRDPYSTRVVCSGLGRKDRHVEWMHHDVSDGPSFKAENTVAVYHDEVVNSLWFASSNDI